MTAIDADNEKSAVPGVILLFLIIPGVIFRGYFMSLIYAWFTPTTWPEMTTKTMIGVSILYQVFTMKKSDFKKSESDPWDGLAQYITLMFIAPLCTLGLARVLLWFL